MTFNVSTNESSYSDLAEKGWLNLGKRMVEVQMS
jgi:hypothetical protein